MLASLLVGLLLVGCSIAAGVMLAWALSPVDVDRTMQRASDYATGQMAEGWPRRFHILRWRR